jgi:hypothetical protein
MREMFVAIPHYVFVGKCLWVVTNINGYMLLD